MLRNTKVELLWLCSNLKRKRSRTLQRIAILCTVNHLNQGDVILKSLRVRMSAERSGKLAMILSTAIL